MASLRAFFFLDFHHLFRNQNPSRFLKTPVRNPFALSNSFSSHPLEFPNPSSIYQRYFSCSAKYLQQITSELNSSEDDAKTIKQTKKPLDVFFKEAIGMVKNSENVEEDTGSGYGELQMRLKRLEEEVRVLREQRKIKKKMKEKDESSKEGSQNKPKQRSLFALFTGEEGIVGEKLQRVNTLRMEDPGVHKELSSDMLMFVTHLYKEGYFKDSNFLPKNKFDASCFQNSYARDFVKFAAEKFGKDNQEIAKWLSASDLKRVALFGCPSLAKKNVFSAKRLRTFFRIPENTVCNRCAVRKSCRYVNQSVWKGDTKTLILAVIMRVITLYALESVPSELVVPEEIKVSAGKLLKEAVNLSQTVNKSA